MDGAGPIISSQTIPQFRGKVAHQAQPAGDSVSIGGENAVVPRSAAMFFSMVHSSKTFVNNVLSGEHAISGPWGLSIRREHTGMKFPVGAPFVKPDGELIVLGNDQLRVIDGKSFTTKGTTPLPNKSSAPCFYAPAFSSDGTAYYVSDDDRNLCIFKDGVRTVPNDNDESITTPVTISKNGIAYGDRDGRICLLDFEGKMQRTHYVGMNFSLAVHAPAGPAAVLQGTNGRIYAATGDKRIFGFTPDNQHWEKKASGKETPKLTESNDGTMLLSGEGNNLVARDPADGEVKWSVPLKGNINWEAVQDRKGTIFAYAGGEVTIISPDGTPKGSFGTEVKEWYGPTRISIAENGNICLNVNHREFHVYAPDGTPIVKLSNRDLFNNDATIGDFTLTPDGSRVLITGREGDITEVTLPESLEKRISAFEAAGGPGKTDTVVQEEETVWIAGVSLAKRTALAQSLLPIATLCEKEG